MAMYNAEPAPIALGAENVIRGTLFALIVVPVGIAVWVIVWNIGIIASIISFGVAWGAVQLYRLGSGGAVSRVGAIIVSVITLVTVGLAIFAGIVSEAAIALGEGAGTGPVDALMSRQFWPFFTDVLSQPDVQAQLLPSVLIAIGFGVLGCFSTLRTVLRATSANRTAQATQTAPVEGKPITPTTPEDPTQR
jgi:hypothetical protein